MQNVLTVKSIVLGIVIFIGLTALSGCLVDESGSNGADFFDNRGYITKPSYKTLTINGLKPQKVGVGFDSSIIFNPSHLVLGRSADIEQRLFFRINLSDNILPKLSTGTDFEMALMLYLDSNFYLDSLGGGRGVFADLWKSSNSIPVTIGWMIETEEFGDSLLENSVSSALSDSLWNQTMLGLYRNTVHSDTALLRRSLSTSIYNRYKLTFPPKLTEQIVQAMKPYVSKGGDSFAGRLHIWIEQDEDGPMKRFDGLGGTKIPTCYFYTTGPVEGFADSIRTDSLSTGIVRSAHAGWVNQVAKDSIFGDNLVLHSAVRESLYFELPKPVIDSLVRANYAIPGDFTGINADLVVLHASLKMAVQDDRGSNELGMPIQALAYSVLDSVHSKYQERRLSELRQMDSVDVIENAHSNLLMAGRDTVILQYSGALRYLVSTHAQAEHNSLQYVKLGSFPVRLPNDPKRFNYYDEDGNLIVVNGSYTDFSYYDFGKKDDLQFQLELRVMDLSSASGDVSNAGVQ